MLKASLSRLPLHMQVNPPVPLKPLRLRKPLLLLRRDRAPGGVGKEEGRTKRQHTGGHNEIHALIKQHRLQRAIPYDKE